MKVSIQELMRQSGVAFGTSGARGLATAMTDRVCYAYTRGFLQYLESIGELKRTGERVAFGGDFRPSTDRVMAAVARAVADLGYQPVNCGKVPSPAVALYGLVRGVPAIMVTGSGAGIVTLNRGAQRVTYSCAGTRCAPTATP